MRDELTLDVLARWEDGCTPDEIADAVGLPSKSAAFNIVLRVHDADPEALNRKPKCRAA